MPRTRATTTTTTISGVQMNLKMSVILSLTLPQCVPSKRGGEGSEGRGSEHREVIKHFVVCRCKRFQACWACHAERDGEGKEVALWQQATLQGRVK